MKKTAIIAAFAALAFAAPGFAHTVVYTAGLSGTSEVGPNLSPGGGVTSVTVDFDLLTMRVQAVFAGLVGNTTASHIHCCTAPGSNASVATQSPSFSAFPIGVKSGVFDQTFNMTLESSYSPAFFTANGSNGTQAFNALTAAMNSGLTYLNIHTSSFPGGEIRGNLTAPVPLPAAAWLLITGVGALGMFARRRKGLLARAA
jgi:hypothetical protein